MLDGSAPWYYFGGLSFLCWSTWFGACRVTASLYYLLSSNRDDSFQKEKTSSVFLPRELRQNRGTCVRLFCFLSKNENNNGFDTICLNSPLFGYKRVAKIYFTVVFRIVFSSRFGLDWMRNLHNEHHLAAKIGTFLHVKIRGRLYYE
jgi:hypothetical protein